MAERNAAAGSMAIGRQTSPTTPVTPTILTPYYKQNLITDLGLIEDKVIYGSKFEVLQQLQNSREHRGGVTVMAEPNTAMYWLDMILTLISTTTAGGLTTRTYVLSNGTDPNFYTIDVNLVSQVVRFFGVTASKIAEVWNNGEMQFDLDLSGLGSFAGREIASIAAQVITLKTDYDPAPTTGLVVGDLIAVKSVDGTRNISLTVSALTATTVTVTGTATGTAAGDMLVIRPNTTLVPDITTPFLWPLTNYNFGTTAAAALAGSQTRLEPGTTVEVIHGFQNEGGEKRSGGFDPASLIRTTGRYNFKTKQFFDNPDQMRIFHGIQKQAAVARHFSGSAPLVSELRLVMNHFKVNDLSRPTDFGETIYQEIGYGPQYDLTDGQGMSYVLINQKATL